MAPAKAGVICRSSVNFHPETLLTPQLEYEFDSFPKTDAIMLNYKSIVGDPFLPFIGCLIPTDESDSCRIFDWSDNKPEIDGVKERLFLEFRDDKTYSLTM